MIKNLIISAKPTYRKKDYSLNREFLGWRELEYTGSVPKIDVFYTYPDRIGLQATPSRLRLLLIHSNSDTKS